MEGQMLPVLMAQPIPEVVAVEEEEAEPVAQAEVV
jgi:hypothetical protein